MFKKLDKNGFYYGFPVLLMTTEDKESGKSNITPLSSSFVLGKTIVIGIGLRNKGFKNIEMGLDVTFNIPDENLYENVKKIEKFTGDIEVPEIKQKMGYEYCEDKFKIAKFTELRGKTVDSVRIKECPIHIETKVENIVKKDWFAIVTCEIQGIFVDEKILKDDTHIDTQKWKPLIYKFREYTSTGDRLGLNFNFQEI